MPKKQTTKALVPAGSKDLARQTRDGRSRGFIAAAKAPNTIRAYQADWRHFTEWAQSEGREALPASPETVVAYLTDLADVAKVATLERRVASISQAHQMAKLESPTRTMPVRTLMAGIRRRKGVAPKTKRPILTEDLRAMLDALLDGLFGVRDRAILLVGFAGGFRRSELVGLDREDLVFNRQGVEVTLRRSKTDQEGAGRKIGIPEGKRAETCPVRSLKAWLAAAKIETGPVFRPISRHGVLQPNRLTAQSVGLIVKRYAEACGKEAADFGGHSLRSGHATQAAQNGASERAIMNQTGHRSLKMVRQYIRQGSLFRENAASKLDL